MLRFDLPYGAVVPALVGATTGVHRLVARPMIESTCHVLDTPDHKLLRWGIELARIAETGQWVLRAPGWQPVLAAESISEGAEDEIPVGFAAPVVPFRRGAVLGPRLTAVTRRHPFNLVDAAQQVLGELRDERTTVTGRDRQVTTFRNLTLIPRHLHGDQVSALVAALEAAGAVRVEEFAGLGERLGLQQRRAGSLTQQSPIEDFVVAQLGSRWRQILWADLRFRTGQATDDEGIREQLSRLRHELSGLAPLLQGPWVERCLVLIEGALGHHGRPLIHGDRYRNILDMLAEACQTPPLDQVAGRQAGPALAQQIESFVQALADQCRALGRYSGDARWARASLTAEQCCALVAQSREVFGKPAKVLGKRLGDVADALRLTVRPDEASLTRNLQGLSAAEIFEAGRAYERVLGAVDYARQQFSETWPTLWRRLRPEVIRP